MSQRKGHNKARGRYGQVRYNNARTAWVNANGNEFILYDLGQENESGDEAHEDVVGFTIFIRLRSMSKPLRIPLTVMTEKELTALKKFFNYAFDRAIPVAQMLDQEARQAWEEDDSGDYARLYRTAPVFVVRERNESQHRPGVQGGPEGLGDVAGGEGDDGPSSG